MYARFQRLFFWGGGCRYTVDQLQKDFSTKPRIPGPEVKGANKAEGGVCCALSLLFGFCVDLPREPFVLCVHVATD